MPEYKCSGCDYVSYIKSHVKDHINKKNKCKEDELKIIVNLINFDCEYCNKKFSIKSNLTRHLKTCKVRKSNILKELEIEKEKVKNLEQKLAVAEALANKPTTVNNNQINIQLTPWNNPTLPEDIEKYYKEAVRKIFLAIPTLIKQIHFNSELPQNHNISITNMRSGTAKVFNGKEWETMDQNELVNSLIDDYELSLNDYANEKCPIYIEKMQAIKNRDSEEKVYDDLKGEVKRVIYDRNHMIKKNKINK